MNLADFELEARRRSPWEAADLGIPMLRRSLPQMIPAAIYAYTPALIIVALFARESPLIAQAILWWCKPWYDRCYLAVLSRQVFGVKLDMAGQRAQLKQNLAGLLSGLTIYRLDPVRSFNLPVWQLERLSGKSRWQRATVLQRGFRYQAAGLTLGSIHFEAVIFFGLYGLLWWLAPESANIDLFAAIGAEEGAWAWAGVAFYFVAINIVEPIYVASGFSLYLNRRIDLEGWDVEISFRRIVQRVSAAAVVSGLLILSATSIAQAEPVDLKKSREVIEQVYERPEFGEEATVTRWRWRDNDAEVELDNDFGDSVVQIGDSLALAFKILFILMIGAFVLWAVQGRAWQRWGRSQGTRKPVQTVAGLDIRRESLPDDVATAAAEALSRGDIIGALSLLYRGSLAYLVQNLAMPIDEADTEGDCLRRAEPVLKGERWHFFRELTNHWLAHAYSGRPTRSDDVAQLIERYRSQMVADQS